MGAGWAVYQIEDKTKRPAIFGSCTFGEREQNYGQPKTEVYGVYRALKELRHRVWGVRFRLDHDALSLAQMIRQPDDVPNAPILRWVSWIRLFDFEPNHVPATSFKVEDGLSRRGAAPEDQKYEDPVGPDEFLEAFINTVYYSNSAASQGSTFTSASRFLFDSLFIKFSSPFISTIHFPHSIPRLQNAHFTSIPFPLATSPPSYDPRAPNSLFFCSAMRFSPAETTQVPNEFLNAKEIVQEQCNFLFGDEVVSFEITYYQPQNQSVPLALSGKRHQFGIPDQESLEMWEEIKTYLQTGKFPIRCQTDKARLGFQKRSRRFLLEHGRLWLAPKKSADSLPRLVIMDKSRRGELMAEAHNECGHKGRDALYLLLSERFYWPNMYSDIQYFVRSCIECQKSIKRQPIIPYNPSWQAPLLRHFKLDCIHMPKGVGGFEYIVHAVEPMILWPEAKSLKSLTASSVASFIYRSIICRFSCVPVISMDGGPEFKKEVKELLRTQYKCTVIISTSYHPEGNAVVERAHQPLVDAIFKCTGDAKGNWPKYLELALFAVRVTVSHATGFSPYYLLYGVHPVFSFDAVEETWQTLDWHMVHTHEDLLAIRILQLQRRDPKLHRANEKLRQSRLRAIQDWEKCYNHKFDFSDYEEGMWVWLRESQLDETKGNKGEGTYSGPYIIHEKRPNGSFVLRELSGAVIKGHVNVHRLRLFFYRPDNQTLKTDLTPRFRRTQPPDNPEHTLGTALAIISRETQIVTSYKLSVLSNTDLLVVDRA